MTPEKHLEIRELRDRAIKRSVEECRTPPPTTGDSWETLLKRAISLLETQLKAEPKDVSALTSLGAFLSDIGRHRDAVTVLERAIALGSDDAVTYYNMGAAMMNLEDYRPQARTFFAKASELVDDPESIRAYFDPHGH
jgi:tetratricopeptide (TPR) repeat protein